MMDATTSAIGHRVSNDQSCTCTNVKKIHVVERRYMYTCMCGTGTLHVPTQSLIYYL
jgi:predicted SprT family Zn-dependent metalloprotease